jgi:hypothetical protein
MLIEVHESELKGVCCINATHGVAGVVAGF